MTTRTAGLGSLALAALLVPVARAQSTLIGIGTGGSTVFEIDPATGALTALGNVSGGGTLGALAYDAAADVLFLSSTSMDGLYRLDPVTFVATLIGPYNVGSTVVMHGLEVDPATGRLYGHSSSLASGVDLFEIDRATGAATPIGATGVLGFGSLASIGGTMYLSDTVNDSLFTVDVATATVAPVGPFGVVGSVGIGFAYDPAHGLLATDNVTDALYSIDLATGAATLIGPHGPGNVISLVFLGGGLGTNYCQSVANSTGVGAVISAAGSGSVAANDITLRGTRLPAGAFGYFLSSQTQGFLANPGGSQGILCLGGAIGRFVGPGQVQAANAAGTISIALDLAAHPTPGGLFPVTAGETWSYQAWYRDSNPGVTSNFTDGISISYH